MSRVEHATVGPVGSRHSYAAQANAGLAADMACTDADWLEIAERNRREALALVDPDVAEQIEQRVRDWEQNIATPAALGLGWRRAHGYLWNAIRFRRTWSVNGAAYQLTLRMPQ